MKVVLASHNKGKLVELAAILEAGVPELELVGYDGPEPIEDGTSYLANALIKARAANQHTGLPAIADDSGIAVEILGGSPGIFSARWSGTRDAATNRQLLLAQLEDVAPEHRAAAFVCTPSRWSTATTRSRSPESGPARLQQRSAARTVTATTRFSSQRVSSTPLPKSIQR